MSDKTCFVIMPYGRKQDIDGNLIDFDEVYADLIVKAVGKIPDLEVLRCDDIELPGWVHKKMIEHIHQDSVAIVDTSTLNANVFYELGVRHALRRNVTVLIHSELTSWPFNINGLSSIKYGNSKTARREARKQIRAYVQNALSTPSNVDSLVHEAIPGLHVSVGPERTPQPITRFGIHDYLLENVPGKKIGFVTGDYAEFEIGEVRVTSENTNMQMDSFYGKSTSATVRYLGAEKHRITGRVKVDTIGILLHEAMDGEISVLPGMVVVTGAGALKEKGVKWIFHIASVEGQPRKGYRPIENVEECITNGLRKADDDEVKDDPPRSILFPIFGTGQAGGDVRDAITRLIVAAVDYLETNQNSNIQEVYFWAWSDMDLEACHEAAGEDGCAPPPGGELG